jgi:hypothetical protein
MLYRVTETRERDEVTVFTGSFAACDAYCERTYSDEDMDVLVVRIERQRPDEP